MSFDNTSMMEIYPYGGIMAYLKYHYIDGLMKQTVMIMDKTRTDYGTDKNESGNISKAIASNPKSDEEIKDILANFGMGQ